MRVLASALAAALVLGATPALADVPAAKKAVRTAEAGGAAKQQNGKVLVIPAKPSMRSRVSAWLSSWRSNGGEVAGATTAAAEDQPQPKAKKQRRASTKNKTRSAKKVRQQQVASRETKRQRPAAQRATRKPVEAAETPAEIQAAAPPTADNPAAATAQPPAPQGLTSLIIEPALAAPPDVRRVPPAHTLRSPLADIPAVTLFMPAVPATAKTPSAKSEPVPEPAGPPAIAAAPAEPEQPLPPATSRIHKLPDTTDEATWWRNEGQPAVMDLRDCLAAYAAREAPRQPETSLNALVVEASRTECRAPLEEMMTTLTMRYGSERLEPVMGTLITDTFMPAARTAAEDAMRTAQSQAVTP